MFSSGYDTVMSSKELVAGLAAVRNGTAEVEYLPVELVSPNKPPLSIKVKLTTSVLLANEGELLRCVTDKGKKVDFLILHTLRERNAGILTASVVIEDGVD